MPAYDVDLPDPEDEVISGGGLPRWLTVVGVLLAVAFAVTVIQHASMGGGHEAAPVPTATRTPPSSPPPNFAWDLARSPTGTWLLETRTLAQVSGTRVARSIALRGLAVPPASVPKLAVDDAANRVWVVLTNAAPTRMVEFDATTLQRVRDVTWAHLVEGAVALHDHLYLSTDFGVAELPPGAARPHYVLGLAGSIGPVVVDAARNRVITMDLGYPTDIWSYRPGESPQEAAMPIAMERGTVAVVGDTIWVAGRYESGRAVLLRLNPTTLQPMLRAPAREYRGGAVLVGTGSRVLWLRSGGSGNLLACVDAATGRVEQRWQVLHVNAVTSTRAGALVATPSGVVGLVLSSCSG